MDIHCEGYVTLLRVAYIPFAASWIRVGRKKVVGVMLLYSSGGECRYLSAFVYLNEIGNRSKSVLVRQLPTNSFGTYLLGVCGEKKLSKHRKASSRVEICVSLSLWPKRKDIKELISKNVCRLRTIYIQRNWHLQLMNRQRGSFFEPLLSDPASPHQEPTQRHTQAHSPLWSRNQCL